MVREERLRVPHDPDEVPADPDERAEGAEDDKHEGHPRTWARADDWPEGAGEGPAVPHRGLEHPVRKRACDQEGRRDGDLSDHPTCREHLPLDGGGDLRLPARLVGTVDEGAEEGG